MPYKFKVTDFSVSKNIESATGLFTSCSSCLHIVSSSEVVDGPSLVVGFGIVTRVHNCDNQHI